MNKVLEWNKTYQNLEKWCRNGTQLAKTRNRGDGMVQNLLKPITHHF